MYDKDNSGEQYDMGQNDQLQKYRWFCSFDSSSTDFSHQPLYWLDDKVKYLGTIEMKEMVEIIGTLYEMEGLQKVQILSFDFSNFLDCNGKCSIHLCHNCCMNDQSSPSRLDSQSGARWFDTFNQILWFFAILTETICTRLISSRIQFCCICNIIIHSNFINDHLFFSYCLFIKTWNDLIYWALEK